MNDTDPPGIIGYAAAGQFIGDLLTVAHQDQFCFRMNASLQAAFDDFCGRVIASHGIDGDFHVDPLSLSDNISLCFTGQNFFRFYHAQGQKARNGGRLPGMRPPSFIGEK